MSRNNIIIFCLLIGVGVYFVMKQKEESAEKPASLNKKSKEQAAPEIAKPDQTPVIDTVINESEKPSLSPSPTPETTQTAEIKNSVPVGMPTIDDPAIVAAVKEEVRKKKLAKLTTEEKLEDLKDYTEVLKPILSKKYPDYRLIQLIEQAGLFLKDEKGYEKVYGDSRTSEVRVFLSDIESAKEESSKEARLKAEAKAKQ